MASNVIVNVLGDNRSLNKALDSSRGRLSKFGSAMKTAAKVGALAFAGGALLAGKALFDMTKNAVADAAAQRRLALALKNTTGANKSQIAGVESWIAKQGKVLGITDDELRPAFQRLAQSTGDIGEAQRLASIAMDASAGSGKKLQTVSEALAKAQAGNLGALSKLGVRIKDAKGETLSFDQITKQMASTFKGQAAASANSLEGKMRRLNVMFDEAKETIGAKLIPVVTVVATFFLNRVVPAVTAFGSALAKNLSPYVDKLGTGFGALARKIAPVGDWLRAHPEVIKGIGIAFGVAAVAAGVFAIAMGAVALATSPITLTIVAIAALGAGIALLWKHSQTFRTAVTAVGEAIKKAMAAVVPAVAKAIDFVTAKWSEIGPEVTAAFRTISDTVKVAIDFIKAYVKFGIKVISLEFRIVVGVVTRLWNMFGKNIVSYLRGAFASIKQIVKGAFQIIRGIFKVFSSLLKGDWKGVWTGIKLILKGAANVVIGMVKNLWNTVKFAFKNAGVILKAVMRAAWDGITSLVKAGAGKVIDLVKSVPDKIRDLGGKFLDAGKAVMGKIFDGIKSGAGGVVGFISDIASSIKSAINSALHLPFTIHGPGPLPDFTIPAFAQGGIVRGPTLALIGEAGPEAVVPLRQKGGISLVGGGNHYTLNVTVDPTASPADVGRAIIKAIDAFEAAGGRRIAL